MPGASGAARRRRNAQRTAEHALDLFARHAARAQQGWPVEAGDDGGFDADGAGAAIED